MASSLGKMPTTSVRRLISPLSRSSGFVEWSLARCPSGRSCRRARPVSASSMKAASLGTFGRIWSATRAIEPGGLRRLLGEGGGDEGGDDAPAALAGMRQRIAHEVNAAALPGRRRTLATAALRPSWASETTSFTPRRPRRVSLRRNSVQNGSASEAPISMPSTSRRPSQLTPTAMMTATETMRPPLAHLQVGGVDPQIGPVAFDRPLEEGLHLAVDLLAEPGDLALGDAAHAHGLDQIVDRARRDALDIGFLDDGGKRLLGHAARFQEAREVGALPSFGMRSSTVPARVSQSRSR